MFDCTERWLACAAIQSLCAERHVDWEAKLGGLQLKATLLTADTDHDAYALQHSDLMQVVHCAAFHARLALCPALTACIRTAWSCRSVATPEKWDALTRRWYDICALTFSGMCRAVLIWDPVYLCVGCMQGRLQGVPAADPPCAARRGAHARHRPRPDPRGHREQVDNPASQRLCPPSLACLTIGAPTHRMRLREDDGAVPARFVAISATIPNVYDLARWLAQGGMPARALVFGPEYRPVPLHQVVLAFPYHKNPFLFDNNLNFRYAARLRAVRA